jgi:hypothetical protein
MKTLDKIDRAAPQQMPSTREVIIAWRASNQTAIGATELRAIQKVIRDQCGADADESPAAIARVLADEGADLRHPEVIEFDARWREAKLEKQSRRLKGLEDLLTGKPLRLAKAEALMRKLERLRIESSSDQTVWRQVRNLAINGRQIAVSLARDSMLDHDRRDEQAEIAEWLKVWIQTPALFADWLELRRRSAEFKQKFSAKEVAP